MKILWIFSTVFVMLAACTDHYSDADAYGNFEAVETIISSENSGRILEFHIRQGQTLKCGEFAALVDTTLPVLRKKELLSQKAGVQAKLQAAKAQIELTDQKMINLRIDLERVRSMVQNKAAPQKQLDDLEGREKILEKQLAAVQAQKNSIVSELQAIEAKQEQLEENIHRCRVVNPAEGTVLNTFAEKYEMTAAGKPLYKIAALDTMNLIVFVSGGDLYRIKVGQDCTVRVDKNKEYIEYSGRITWISDEAEFTPKMIQTKKERINWVYAVKIAVPNDGRIKIGMPGEVVFR